ncbi:protein YdjC [Lelliottia amnigena]|nr:protein YdjC [Lelliottia amnigena]
MDKLLIVNADDFGLSKGQNYGIVEACRHGVVTSTTALVNGEAVEHAAALAREWPGLGVGMHFVLTLGMPLSSDARTDAQRATGKMDLADGGAGDVAARRNCA